MKNATITFGQMNLTNTISLKKIPVKHIYIHPLYNFIDYTTPDIAIYEVFF